MLTVGKKYIFIRETRETVRRFTAKVTWIEDRGDFWYIGYAPDDIRNGVFGAVKVKKEGKYKAINYRFEEVAA